MGGEIYKDVATIDRLIIQFGTMKFISGKMKG